MKYLSEDREQHVQQSKARPYNAPRLVVYGAVRDITSGGTGKASENNQGGVKPRP
jgi:hypothetical protein